MSTKTKKVISDAVGDLDSLMHLVQVCGFAAEARRVLNDISSVAMVRPALCEDLDSLVSARNEWTYHEDSLGIALRVIAQQLNDIHSRLEGEC